ncbi:hypothetical protein [Pelagibaculum spongiae]|nr:hypothetical protein [Pelagibaculum spongiae]
MNFSLSASVVLLTPRLLHSQKKTSKKRSQLHAIGIMPRKIKGQDSRYGCWKTTVVAMALSWGVAQPDVALESLEDTMNTLTSKLEQMAYGHATSQFISSDNDFEGTWYERYQFLADCVENSIDPDGWFAWAPFETWEWRDIVTSIDDEASSLVVTMKQALEYAKGGMVVSAINGSLDSDMNQLDMIQLLELGAKEQQ